MSVSMQDSKNKQSGQNISQRLGDLRQKVRVHLGASGGSQVLVLLVILSFVSLMADYYFRLSYGTRVVQALIFGSGIFWFVRGQLYARLSRPLKDADLALAVERSYPELDCRLVSAIQFIEGDKGGNELVSEVISQADTVTQSLDFGVVLDWDKLKERLMQAGAALVFALLIANYFTVLDLDQGKQVSAAPIWFKRNVLLMGSENWPRSTRLQVTIKGFEIDEGRVAVPAGTKLDIEVEAEGVVPRKVFIAWKNDEEGLGEIAQQMSNGQGPFSKIGENSFVYSFSAVDSSFTMTITGGDDSVPPISVRVVRRPWVRELSMTPEYPAHTGQENEPIESGIGDLSVPEGTKMTIRGRSSKRFKELDDGDEAPVAWVNLAFPAEPEIKKQMLMNVSGKDEFEVALIVSQTVIAELNWRDYDNLTVESPPRLSFQAIEDTAPRVFVKASGIGNLITNQASVPMEIEAIDNYGLTKGAIVYSYKSADGKSKEVVGSIPIKEFEGAAGGERIDLEKIFEVSEIKALKPGSFLELWIEAYDNDGLRSPKQGRSQVLSFRVVTAAELMNDMVRRQYELRKEFEKLYDLERTLAKALKAGLANAELGYDAARRQRRVAEKVGNIRKEMLQIFEEMKNNKFLENKADRDKLGELLMNLKEEIRASRSTLEEYASKLESRDLRDGSTEKVTQIVINMKFILDQMIAIELLTGLIDDLQGIKKQTKDNREDLKGKIGGE
ncbi:MAG: hypothetical protein P1V97_11490 [Planctomycetota bacterium]|nr:hypothetical protein [Planctomycetota bacterium]